MNDASREPPKLRGRGAAIAWAATLVALACVTLLGGSPRDGARMNDASREPPKLHWRGPAIAWTAILCALTCVVLLGIYGSGELRFGGALVLAAVMLFTLAFGLVGVANEPPLMRLVAGAAFMFLALMFFLSFNDLVTRIRYHP
jgi:hypothetical protein